MSNQDRSHLIRSIETVNTSGVTVVPFHPTESGVGDPDTLTDVRALLLKWAARGVSIEQAGAELLGTSVELCKAANVPGQFVATAVLTHLKSQPSEDLEMTVAGIAWSSQATDEESETIRAHYEGRSNVGAVLGKL